MAPRVSLICNQTWQIRKKRKKTLIFGTIGLLLAGLTTTAIIRKHDVIITVQTEKAERRNVTEIVVANGKVQPVLQVKISPEVSGEIIELPVKEGQNVKKGDLILKSSLTFTSPVATSPKPTMNRRLPDVIPPMPTFAKRLPNGSAARICFVITWFRIPASMKSRRPST